MPVDEALFEMVFCLCKEYPALSPFEIDERRFVDVIDLFADTRRLQIRAEKERDFERTPDAEKVIRREAGDSWF